MSYRRYRTIALDERVRNIIADPESKKVLATVSREGIPHATFKGSLRVADDGLIEYYEIIESSQTNRNMVYSLWFDKSVSINVLLGSESFLIEGKVDRAITAGAEFERHYAILSEKNIELSTLWRIVPLSLQEESFEKRRDEEIKSHQILQHLDRLL